MANTLNTEAVGVFQSDIIIRTAIIAAINDLRANPWLLDYVFASLRSDSLTLNDYGDSEIARAKEWFQKTNIAVIWNIGLNEPQLPAISIALQSSQEVESEGTLSDTHYQPFEDNNWNWPVLVGPITPTGYTASTGTIVLDPTFIDIVLAPGMVVVTRAGKQYPILEVTDVGTVKIAAGTVDDFDGMVIKTANPAYITELESAVFREVYALGCHVDSEPVHLTYLHSILVFVLKRYNQALLEARGFERSTITSTDFKREDGELPEFLYSRYIQITGSVRQAWPKTIAMKVSGALVAAQESQVGTNGVASAPVSDLDVLLNSDPLSLIGS